MIEVDAVRVLNARFDCTRCHAPGSWVAMTRPALRQNSIIHQIRCARCLERIVAKVSRADGLRDAACAQTRREYETLCTLQRVFPQDEHYGTLVPLGYLESSGQGILITHHFRGGDLAHYVRSLNATGAQEACHAAGFWLRKLHESSDAAVEGRVLGVADKLEYLAATYGAALRGDRKAWAAYQCLEQTGSRIDTRIFPVVRQHGDFKPDNILCDGTRYVGLDIQWQIVGPAVYDLAPFLNSLWLAVRRVGDLRISRHRQQAETGFLAGYGSVVDMRALRWAQLYFALCQLGGYRKRGRLVASYANWTVWPLVRKLASQLAEAS